MLNWLNEVPTIDRSFLVFVAIVMSFLLLLASLLVAGTMIPEQCRASASPIERERMCSAGTTASVFTNNDNESFLICSCQTLPAEEAK